MQDAQRESCSTATSDPRRVDLFILHSDFIHPRLSIRNDNSMERTKIKLREANFFRQNALNSEGEEFLYYMSATLSACRSVTFALQKEHSGEENFDDWYSGAQSEMKSDPLMRVLSELRNHVVKRTLVTPVGETEHQVIDKKPKHPDFAGEPSIDGKTFTRHKLDKVPEDVKSNIPDDIVEAFLREYGDDSIESWLNNYYFKAKRVVIEGGEAVKE
ncbi:hypothetical protein [Halonotius roseus]|uniref:Uncharacterized protein n=1 Tax=Halonotius roseus TaxID=2511997 RepID=A0A544QS21_9EURY|nr:hypothetical protein [Halonotius roseus]TQQ82244.1 hypothetical protein EWF95_04730 [Halonotius roseus]